MLLAAFISGLKGVPGRHVRLQMPDTVEMALNMAIVATNVESSERNDDRDESFQTKGIHGKRQPCKFTGTQCLEPLE
jgi:hypothetical protein